MIIKKLELQGFKSFPERTKIIFHPGITVIIGPNGTGKSNIVDAMLWVLGSSRLRSLRGEKSEDVIFHGNPKKAPLGMADVNLSLSDDEEKMLINHRFFRSGESEYRLNGKTVRLKDIQESLWKKSIAEKDYYIIEQGTIDRILTSKPTEKRQFLEEAAGTAYYKDKKRQTQSKLENSEQNLIRLEDIITEVSKAKNSLKRQANATVKYRKLREKIRHLTLLHFRKKMLFLEKNKDEITARYNLFLEQERKILSRKKTEEKELAAKNREVWNLEKSIKESHDALYSSKSELSRIEAELEANKRRIEFFEGKRKKADLNRRELKEELKILKKELQTSEINLTSLKDSLKEKQQALHNTDQENRSNLEKMAEKEKKVESLREVYLQKISGLSEIKNEVSKTEKELELIIRQEEKLQSQLDREHVLLKEKEKELAKTQSVLSQANRVKEEKNKSLTELKKEGAKVNFSIENLQNKISELADKKERSLHHLQVFKKLEENEQIATLSQNIPGAVGPLADLVESEPQDIPLIDVFWKEEAKSILIPTQDFLKNFAEKKITGNFLLIPPDEKEDSTQEIIRHPSVIGLLKSRLRANPKVKKYLPYLREAVIVKDIKSAIKLWLTFPSFDFITIKGDLLLSSGLIKLGQREEGIIALRQEIKRLKEKITLAEKSLIPLTSKLNRTKEVGEKLEKKILKETNNIAEEEREVNEIEKSRVVEKAEREKIASTISLLRKELDSMKLDEQKITRRTEALSLEQKILKEEEKQAKKELETAEQELASHQEKNSESSKKFYGLKANLELLNEKIRNLEHQIKTLIQRKENTQEKTYSLQEEIRNCREEELKLKEHNKDLTSKRKNLKALKTEKDITLAQDESSLLKLKKELEEQEKSIKDLDQQHEASKEERIKWEISRAENDRDLANLDERCWQDLKKTLKEVKEEISEEEVSAENVEVKLEELNTRLQKLKAVNLMAEEEYLVQKKRYDFLLQQRNDLRSSIDTTKEAIKKIDQESKTQFLKAFNEVNKKFQEVFSLLFEGGKTELKLTDATNPIESGIDIIAQPPGKKVQNMMLLSGGEKALTSLAFLFALFRYRPTPFCILDEVDAALDDTNLARFLELMKKIKSQTQFIIVTHNFKTMEVADYIYGTTMAEPSVTNLYSLKLEEKEGS